MLYMKQTVQYGKKYRQKLNLNAKWNKRCKNRENVT